MINDVVLSAMTNGYEESVHEHRPGEEIAAYIEACRQRIPQFINTNYAWPGAIALNRRALGTDILAAPFNFLMGFPNFLLQTLAVVLGLLGARRAASLFARSHLGLSTSVQRTLSSRLMTQLLQLSTDAEKPGDRLCRRIHSAAQEPVRIYVQTRNVAADITAGTLAAVMGLLLLHQFTPGSLSVSAVLANLAAKQQAVSAFPFGETLGQLYYAVVPVSPSVATLGFVLLTVMAIIAVVAALSGFIHDPVQTVTGIHRRRLNRMLDAIMQSASDEEAKGYRPKDTFFGRVYDIIDWIKGLMSL